MAGKAVVLQGMVSINGADPVPMTFRGEAYDPNLSVGGGPVLPPLGIWGGAPIPWPTPPIYYPPGIWGPNDPRPSHPIVIIPPGAIGPGVPTHPIVLPIYPEHPIVLPPEERPPETDDWQWIYTREGWALLPPGGGGKPQPLPPGGGGESGEDRPQVNPLPSR